LPYHGLAGSFGSLEGVSAGGGDGVSAAGGPDNKSPVPSADAGGVMIQVTTRGIANDSPAESPLDVSVESSDSGPSMYGGTSSDCVAMGGGSGASGAGVAGGGGLGGSGLGGGGSGGGGLGGGGLGGSGDGGGGLGGCGDGGGGLGGGGGEGGSGPENSRFESRIEVLESEALGTGSLISSS
jgi:hypothetical protein